MATINVIDAGGNVTPIEKPLPPGRAAAAASRPIALSNEDLAALNAIETKLSADPATQTTLAAVLAALGTNHTDEQQLHTDIATTILAKLGAVILAAGSDIIGKVDHSTSGIGQGNKTSTTVGTAVALASSQACKWVWIAAYSSNTGRVAVGATGVNASLTAGTGTGGALGAGESIMIPIDNLSKVFIDVTVSGEGVRYTYGS